MSFEVLLVYSPDAVIVTDWDKDRSIVKFVLIEQDPRVEFSLKDQGQFNLPFGICLAGNKISCFRPLEQTIVPCFPAIITSHGSAIYMSEHPLEYCSNVRFKNLCTKF